MRIGITDPETGQTKYATLDGDAPPSKSDLAFLESRLFPKTSSLLTPGSPLQTGTPNLLPPFATTGVSAPPATTQTSLAANPKETATVARQVRQQRKQQTAKETQRIQKSYQAALPKGPLTPTVLPKPTPATPAATLDDGTSIYGPLLGDTSLIPPERQKGLTYPGVPEAFQGIKNFLLGAIAAGIEKENQRPITPEETDTVGAASGAFVPSYLGSVLKTVFSKEGLAAGNKAVGGAVVGQGGPQAVGKVAPTIAPGTPAGELYNAVTSTGLDPFLYIPAAREGLVRAGKRVGRIPYRTTYSRLTPDEVAAAQGSAPTETPALPAPTAEAAPTPARPQKPATAPKTPLLASSPQTGAETPVRGAQEPAEASQPAALPPTTKTFEDRTPHVIAPDGRIVIDPEPLPGSNREPNSARSGPYLDWQGPKGLRDEATLLSQGAVTLWQNPETGTMTLRASQPLTDAQVDRVAEAYQGMAGRHATGAAVKVVLRTPKVNKNGEMEFTRADLTPQSESELRKLLGGFNIEQGLPSRHPFASGGMGRFPEPVQEALKELDNPATPPDRLREIHEQATFEAKGSPERTAAERLLVRNPNSPVDLLAKLASEHLKDLAVNPVAPLLQLEDPNFVENAGIAHQLAAPGAPQVGKMNTYARAKLGLPPQDEDVLGRLFPQEEVPANAEQVHEQSAGGGVLRQEGPPVELQGVRGEPEPQSVATQSLGQTSGKAKRLSPRAASSQKVKASVPLSMRRPRVTPRARIQVAPLPLGDKPLMPRQQILSELAKETGVPIYVEPNLRGNTAGQYHPPNPHTTTKQSGNLDVGGHEQGHATDDAFGLGAAYKDGSPAPWDSELMPHFSAHGSNPPVGIGRKGRLVYRRAEGIAEWINAWLKNPAEAEAAAPTFAKHFKATVPKKKLARLKTLSGELRRYYSTEPAAPRARLASSVRTTKPPKESKVGRLVRELTGKQEGEFFRTSLLDQWRVLFRDKLAPLNTAQGYAVKKTGKTLLPSEDPTELARDLNYYKGKFEDLLTNGYKDETGQRIIDPLTDLFAPLQNIKKAGGDIKKALADARYLAVARRTVAEGKRIDALGLDPAEAVARKRDITGVGGQVFADPEDAQKYIDQLQRDDPAIYKDLVDFTDRFEKASKQTLDYLLEKGRISQEQHDKIANSLDFYAPLQRVLGVDEGLIGPLAGTPSPLGKGRLSQPRAAAYRFSGSGREILDPLTTVLQGVYSGVKEADRNAVLLAWRNLLKGDRALYEGGANDIAQIGREVKPISTPRGPQPPPNSVTIYVDGEPEYWEFDPAIKAALDGMGQLDLSTNVLVAIPRALSDLVHSVATKNLPFALRNKIRDVSERFLISRTASGNPMRDFADLAPLPTKEELSRYQRYGAGLSESRHLDRAEDFHDVLHRMLTDQHLLPKTLRERLIRGMELLGTPAELSEKSTRVSEMRSAYRKFYDQFLKDGLTPEKAKREAEIASAREARNLQDFTRSGTVSQALNRTLFPFLTARIEGSSNFWTRTAKNPKRVLPRVALYGLALGMLEYAWNYAQGGQDTIDERRDFPSYVRDNFYLLKAAPDTWIPIPKAHEAGLFASLADRGIEYAQTGDKEASFDGFTSTLVNGMAPTDMQTVFTGTFTPFVESLYNYSTFRGGPIVPEAENNLALELRGGTRGASRVGKAMQSGSQKAMSLIGRPGGIDARKADYLVESLLGSYGRALTSIGDLGRADRPRASTRLVQSVAGVPREGPGANAASVNRAQNKLAEVGVGPTGKLPTLLRFQRNRVLSAKTGAEKDAASADIRKTAKGPAVRAVVDTTRLKKQIVKDVTDKVYKRIMDDGADYSILKALQGAKKTK